MRGGRVLPSDVRIAVASHRWSWTCAFLVAAVLALAAGCGTLENGHGWGQDTLNPVDLGRVTRAAQDALLDPYTLAPLAGAAVFAISDFDEKVSDWAVEHNPVFGTESIAADASTNLKRVLKVEAYATAVATPSGDAPEQWLLAKTKGIGVELAAVYATERSTVWLKRETDRLRPDGSDTASMPSGHASTASSFMTLANRNLGHIDALEEVRPPLVVGNTFLGLGVGWARVEAGVHYPSDVLVGMALGNFLAAFIHDGLMNLPENENVDFAAFPIADGGGLSLCFAF